MARRAIAVVVSAALVIGGGVWAGRVRPWESSSTATRVLPGDKLIAAREVARRGANATVREITLTAAPATVSLGDRTVKTWAFNGTVPGPEIRLRVGDVLRARVRNQLPAPLTIHWQGIALRNDMDGVPALTQKAIKPGGEMTYEFTAPDPGTYFYHPHTGTQLDRGLYAPLIVEDPAGTAVADRDLTVMLDDWIDGTGQTPDDVFSRLRASSAPMGPGGSGGMSGMSGMGTGGAASSSPTTDMASGMGSSTGVLGSDTGDVQYPLYLINGRSATTPTEFAVTAGERVRLRLINAGSDTPFRVAVRGSKLTVVATDGFPVQPVTVDNLLLGMGERYDVVVTMPGSGAFPLVAVAEGKGAEALAVLRSGPGDAPMVDVAPSELAGRLLSLDDLHAARHVALANRVPDRNYRVTLTGAMMSGYKWGISAPSKKGITLPVREGDRVRLTLVNQTMMWHPIHLHGHTFQVVTGAGTGPRKDTVIVAPMATVTVEFDADNPGQWALHCHNIYHAEAGMVTVLSYVK